MKQIPSALLMLMLLGGCTTTSRLQVANTSSGTVHELNRKTARHDVRVILMNGWELTGRTRFRVDSLRVSFGAGRVALFPSTKSMLLKSQTAGGAAGSAPVSVWRLGSEWPR